MSRGNSKKRPVVVIQVAGGVADYQAVGSDAAVQVIHIDWDNIEEGGDPIGQLVEINSLLVQLRKVSRDVPDDPPGYLKRIIGQLEDARRNCQEMILELEREASVRRGGVGRP